MTTEIPDNVRRVAEVLSIPVPPKQPEERVILAARFTLPRSMAETMERAFTSLGIEVVIIEIRGQSNG